MGRVAPGNCDGPLGHCILGDWEIKQLGNIEVRDEWAMGNHHGVMGDACGIGE